MTKYLLVTLGGALVVWLAYNAVLQFISTPDTPPASTVVSNSPSVMNIDLSMLPLITPIEHASFIMTWDSHVIYNDPVGESASYVMSGLPTHILLTHSHPDHLDIPLLETLLVDGVVAVASADVYAKLPPDLQSRTTVLANGERVVIDDMTIRAVPMYNTTPERARYHVAGVGNGYVIERNGIKVYNASDTEITPEFLAETDIAMVFVPVNLPYTMSVEEAAPGVAAIAPRIVYPYHYRNGDGTFSDLAEFKRLVESASPGTEVVITEWYPAVGN